MGCISSLVPSHGVSGQKECQLKCEASNTCVGISYSHIPSARSFCYLCNDDVLSSVNNGFGFYRKSRNIELQSLGCVYVFISFYIYQI